MKLSSFSLIILQLLNNQCNNHRVWSFTLPSSSTSSFIVQKSNSNNSNNSNSNSKHTTSTNKLSMSEDGNDNGTNADKVPLPLTDAERLMQQAKKMKLEAEKMEAELTLEKIQTLEETLLALTAKGSSSSSSGSSRNANGNDTLKVVKNSKGKNVSIVDRQKEIQLQIQNLCKNIDPSLLPSLPSSNLENVNLFESSTEAANAVSSDTTSLDTSTSTSSSSIETNLYKNKTFQPQEPKKSITEAELQTAVEYYLTLPKPMRKTLANAIDLNDDITSPSIIILGLYEFMGTSTVSLTRLSNLYNDQLLEVEQSTLDKARSNWEADLQQKQNEYEQGTTANNKNNNNNNNNNAFENIFQKASEETKLETVVESFLPRVVTRNKEGLEPTETDINMLKTYKVLGKDTFTLSAKPQKVPGGYIIRGKMAPTLRGDCDRLITLLDEKIDNDIPNKTWNEQFQINVMTDPTPALFDDEETFDGEMVLVVHSRDMKPQTSQLLKTGVTTLSLFLGLVFAIATYSQNEVVMERLTSANAVGDYDATWFNALITPFLLSVGVTQACHEAGHLFIAKKDGFKITPPTVLPLVALPYLSFQQNIKTSPKNFDSLFNFGMIGPAIGMIVSSAFFYAGLQMTLTMDASALEYAPSVPVLFLKLSSLGGTVVDNVIGGGQGIITQQDPLTPVKLHPFAIGGLASLMINCLDTIPIPGTDGGRMSQSLLGRSGQVAFGGVVYFALLAYVFISGHNELFLSFLFVNSFARQDNEIPCRNEIDRAGLGQAAIALLMWCIAILALTPME